MSAALSVINGQEPYMLKEVSHEKANLAGTHGFPFFRLRSPLQTGSNGGSNWA
jgi:hypothetical protein